MEGESETIEEAEPAAQEEIKQQPDGMSAQASQSLVTGSCGLTVKNSNHFCRN